MTALALSISWMNKDFVNSAVSCVQELFLKRLYDYHLAGGFVGNSGSGGSGRVRLSAYAALYCSRRSCRREYMVGWAETFRKSVMAEGATAKWPFSVRVYYCSCNGFLGVYTHCGGCHVSVRVETLPGRTEGSEVP